MQNDLTAFFSDGAIERDGARADAAVFFARQCHNCREIHHKINDFNELSKCRKMFSHTCCEVDVSLLYFAGIGSGQMCDD